jgi:hypothetical protein
MPSGQISRLSQKEVGNDRPRGGVEAAVPAARPIDCRTPRSPQDRHRTRTESLAMSESPAMSPAEPVEWVDDIFGYDWVAHARRVLCQSGSDFGASPKRTLALGFVRRFLRPQFSQIPFGQLGAGNLRNLWMASLRPGGPWSLFPGSVL